MINNNELGARIYHFVLYELEHMRRGAQKGLCTVPVPKYSMSADSGSRRAGSRRSDAETE